MKSRLKDIFVLFVTFFKIGAFTFGGGYAMIPLIEREIIENRKYIDKKDVLDIIAVSASMPGAIAINIATFIGYRVAGYAGSVASILGCVLPSFCIIYAISSLLRQFGDIEVVKFAFAGVRVAVVVLISKALLSLWKKSPKGILPYIIMGAAFVCVALFRVSAIYVIIAGAGVGLAASLIAMRGKEGGAQ
ncbi:MAG: chromate transporter [Eubacteriales bacterium]|jgi:chromate transporter